ncbi:hydroxyacylglutathione hydrolase [Pseudooceanicola algae]|uniref:Hydroxyacylglutathione hydrolase n=1 Tax=Pseudooceanicola algae TaxID=1537215 RepID=A0A418SHW7_9RHOB|nr:hydroxyacylglutathione hydrolase [Pseudooceanicola algae]QPM92073.1 Hydroxyacylglutathione hydrolase GloB [Pseudooceanicola algae]
MALDLVTIPCRSDNYAYLVNGPEGSCIVDAPEAAPIIAEAEARGWTPATLLITHHHGDHVEGIDALRARFPGLTVIGPQAEKTKMPPMDRYVSGGDSFGSGAMRVDVIDVPGHTLGHIAFHMPGAGFLFTADSLMALGCGRVFEGTMEMMFDSLTRLAALPGDTIVCSGHEYTAANGRFAQTIEPENPALISRIEAVTEARAAGHPTVPSRLSEELETNPFMRAHLSSVAAAVGLDGAAPAAVFAELRRRKDSF